MSGDARGGNDSLSATGDVNVAQRRRRYMCGDARGGNDRLSATGDRNHLYGDAGTGTMYGDARGGNDSLTATGDGNSLFGDAAPCPTTPWAATTG